MNKSLSLSVVAGSLMFVFGLTAVRASDSADSASSSTSSIQEKMDQLVELGPGVHNVKKDNRGRVQSLIVVGQSRLSLVLGAAKGKEVARERAELGAKAEFAKWLGEYVEIRRSQNDETTIFLSGGATADQEARAEAGKAVEKNSVEYKTFAAGLVRGLTLLHTDVNTETREYTAVYGWSLANARSAKDTATQDPGLAERPAGKPVMDTGKLRSQKVTSPAAEGFLN